ncbi:MAG: papain-like cysteine protease family protein [Blastocatellia bacterium]
MPITVVQHVPLMSQPTDGVCWMVSAQMVYKWSKATGSGQMKDPMTDSGSKWRYDNNGDWSSAQNGILAGYFNMKTHAFSAVSMSYDSLNNFMTKHGPIWTGLQKNWGGHNHGHVVVICGVADTGVFIHDPEPMKQGTAHWLTWEQIKKALDGLSGADYQYLTAA